MGETGEDLLWKDKCELTEKNFGKLKALAHKAIADYNDLQRKYDQNQKQYEELKEVCNKREAQLKDMEGMLEPVYNQYNKLENKLVIEKGCRTTAEQYASQINKQNKKLKRQSQMLLDKLDITTIGDLKEVIEETEETANESEKQKDEFEHLNATIEELQDQIAEFQHKVQVAEEEKNLAKEAAQLEREKYEREKQQTARFQTSIIHHETQLKQFKRVSAMAVNEYTDLFNKFQQEKTLKGTAEKFATEMLGERNAMKRESAVLIGSAATDERLMKALMEVETLTKTLELERHENKTKLTELENAVAESKDMKESESLEERLQVASDQVDTMEKQLKDMEVWKKKMLKENEDLVNQLDVANQLLHPPPPPPPPLPPGGVLKPLKEFFTKKKKPVVQAKSAGGDKDPNMQSAIEEMMSRIKKGTINLKSANERRPDDSDSDAEEKEVRGAHVKAAFEKPSLPDFKQQESTEENKSAMEELHTMLHTLKKGRSQSSGAVLENIESEGADQGGTSEFLSVFTKIKGTTAGGLALIEEEREGSNSQPNSLDGSMGARDEKRDSTNL